MPIDRKELEAKIEQFLDTQDDTTSTEWYCTDHKVHSDCLTHFTHWLFKADIEREKRYAEFLKLKAEFEPDAPADIKPTVEWRQTPAGAYVASFDGRDVANVWPNALGSAWIAQRWTNGASATGDCKTITLLEEAKSWAVGHL